MWGQDENEYILDVESLVGESYDRRDYLLTEGAHKMNQPSKIGSSLVLVVVVMAVIITAVFSASRLALVQFNQANRDEDNIFAYYAAKAGIEDGLIRFRYNRDAETPTTTSTPPKTKVQRYNLTT